VKLSKGRLRKYLEHRDCEYSFIQCTDFSCLFTESETKRVRVYTFSYVVDDDEDKEVGSTKIEPHTTLFHPRVLNAKKVIFKLNR